MTRPRARIPGATTEPPTVPHPGALALLLDAHRAYRRGPAAVAARQRARLAVSVPVVSVVVIAGHFHRPGRRRGWCSRPG